MAFVLEGYLFRGLFRLDDTKIGKIIVNLIFILFSDTKIGFILFNAFTYIHRQYKLAQIEIYLLFLTYQPINFSTYQPINFSTIFALLLKK
jgi:hypothetical protein